MRRRAGPPLRRAGRCCAATEVPASPLPSVDSTGRYTSVVGDQGQHLAAGQLLAAVEKAELDHEAQSHDGAAELLDQADRRRRGPAGGEHVVDDDHLVAGLDGVTVDLEEVSAVLELVFLALD